MIAKTNLWIQILAWVNELLTLTWTISFNDSKSIHNKFNNNIKLSAHSAGHDIEDLGYSNLKICQNYALFFSPTRQPPLVHMVEQDTNFRPTYLLLCKSFWVGSHGTNISQILDLYDEVNNLRSGLYFS